MLNRFHTHLPQFSSSILSAQSLSRSQTQTLGIQCPSSPLLLHVNSSLSRQVRPKITFFNQNIGQGNLINEEKSMQKSTMHEEFESISLD